MPDNFQLEASKRQVTGKQVKRLRAQDLIPAVLYGPTHEPMNLQVPARDLAVALAEAGGSHLIDLRIDGETYPALVRDVQRDNLRDDLLHVDFYAVAMDRLITAEVPLEFSAEPEAATESAELVLVTNLTTVEVECLPADLPPSIFVDLSGLVDLDSHITAGDLPVPTGVTILDDPEEIIATLSYVRQVEEEEEEEELLEVDAEDVEVIGRGAAEEKGEDFKE